MKHQGIVFAFGIRAVVKDPCVGLRWADGKLRCVARGPLTEAGARTSADAQHPPPTNKDSSMHTLFLQRRKCGGACMKAYHSLFVFAGLDLMTSSLRALQH
jgi:hypothetical protein